MSQGKWDLVGAIDVDILSSCPLCFLLAGSFAADTPGAAVDNFTRLLSED